MAGCYDRTWRVGSKARGTRSQFRLNTQGLLPFKCTYPVHLTDVMDIGQSSQTGLLTAGDLVSPNKGTRTRTVREYEQTISELKKENFDLKLRIFLLEEAINKNSRKDKDGSSEDKDNTVQVIVQLKVETESLRNELSYKNKLLQDSLDQAEKYSSELKELQAEFSQLQEQLSSLSERPSKEEFILLGDEKNNLIEGNEYLANELALKNKEIEELNSKVEELSSRNKHLEEKVKKSCMAIQGVVQKYYKETQLFPKILRPIIQSAVQAAKNNDKEELQLSLKRFKASLCQIMATSVEEFDTVSKENEASNHSKKNLRAETLEFKEEDRVLKKPSESWVELNHVQDLKKIFSENGTSDKENKFDLILGQEFPSCEIMLCDSKSASSVDEDGLVNFLIHSDIHKSTEENIPHVQLSVSGLNLPLSNITNSVITNEVFLSTEESVKPFNDKCVSERVIEPISLKFENVMNEYENESKRVSERISEPTPVKHQNVVNLYGYEMESVSESFVENIPVKQKNALLKQQNAVDMYDIEMKSMKERVIGPAVIIHQNAVDMYGTEIKNVSEMATEFVPIKQQNAINIFDNEMKIESDSCIRSAQIKHPSAVGIYDNEIKSVSERVMWPVPVQQRNAIDMYDNKKILYERATESVPIKQQNAVDMYDNEMKAVSKSSIEPVPIQYPSSLGMYDNEIKSVSGEVVNSVPIKLQNVVDIYHREMKIMSESFIEHVPVKHLNTVDMYDNKKESASERVIEPALIKYQNVENISDKEKEKRIQLQLSDLLKENESLKSDINEKLSAINDLTSTCNELEKKTIQLQSELHATVSKMKQLEITSAEEKGKVFGPLLKANTCTQTSATDLSMQPELDKPLDHVGHSNNIAELKEEMLVLLLTIEEKDKELANLKKDVASLQTELENTSSRKDLTLSSMDPEYLNERNELRERLARSCSVNNELIKHLQNLEAFMEDLLHQRNLDTSSLENISETSDFLSQLSRCLDESLKLSHVLSDNLSICEGSKLFEAGELSVNPDVSVYDGKSSQHLGLSNLSLLATDPYSKFDEGRNEFINGNQEFYKNAAGTGKRRWSYSTQHKNAIGETLVDSDNMVVLGTSNNEDLILLLNENGDPADVLIRNNHTHLSESKLQTSLSQSGGGQLRRRCWEDNSIVQNVWNAEKSSINYHVENMHHSELKSKQTHAYYNHYISSDSDIWSEPDRDISMQRIGIDVKNSPIAPKSPRKLKMKEKRISDELSSEKNASNYSLNKVQSWSRRRRNSGSTGKRLFARESSSKQDYKLEKHYSLLAEKFPKLTSLSTQLQKVKNANSDMIILEDVYEELNCVTLSVSETLQKLSQIRENMKSLSPIICEKCTVLELLLKLEKVRRRIQYSEILQYVSGTDAEVIVHTLLTEVESLKKQLEEPHAILSSGAESSEFENEIYKIGTLGHTSEEKKAVREQQKELEDLKSKVGLLEKELNEARDVSEERGKLLESLKAENIALCNHLNDLKKEVLDLEEKKKILTSDNSEFIQRLTEVNKKNSSLKDVIKELKDKSMDSTIAYNQLKGDLKKTEEQLQKLDAKCLKYEEEILMQSKEKKYYIEKFKTIEIEAQSIKDKFARDIEVLISEKNGLLKNLELEKERTEILEKEKNDLNNTVNINNKEIDSLHALNQELEKAKQSLLSEKAHQKLDLLSTTSLCDQLKNDLTMIRESLQQMELKCTKYEKEFEKSSSNKDNLIDKLSSIKREFASNVCKLSDKYQMKGKESNFQYGKTSDTIPISDKDRYIENLCDELISESNKLLKITDVLMQELNNVYLKLTEAKNIEKSLQLKIFNAQEKIDFQEIEIVHLKQQKEHIQAIIDEQKKCMNDKEKSLRLSDTQVQSLNSQISDLHDIMNQYKFELSQRNDEITTLQERVFNLQTEINNLKAEKNNLETINNEYIKFMNEKAKQSAKNIESIFNSSASIESSDDTVSKEESESNVGNIQESANISMDSVPERDEEFNLVASKNKDTVLKRYSNKIKALGVKLSMAEKRAEILEKEKDDLRENVLAQMQSSKKLDMLAKEKDTLNQKLLDLKSELEKKATFIKELKNDMYKTCSSLIEKQAEIDELRNRLPKYKANIKPGPQTTCCKDFTNNSDIFPQSDSTNIHNLNKRKWALIQAIFSIQKKFYEKKGIHLDHFDKFKNHIENLHSLQNSPTLSKSESEPFLHMVSRMHCGEGKALKNVLIDLELDIECLENLKLFLKRFFIPFVLQNSQTHDSKHDKNNSLFQMPTMLAERDTEQTPCLMRHTVLEKKVTEEPCKDKFKSIEILQMGSDDVSPVHRNKWDKLVWNVACQLECIGNALIALQSEYEYFKEIESSFGDSPSKNVEKLILSKIFHESKLLHQEANKIISLNSALRSQSAFMRNVSKGVSRQDMSDRESLLSDETITLSRSESFSPVSFEEAFPLKIESVEGNVSKNLGASMLQKMSVESKVAVRELFPQKLEAVGSSQDSVFHRSHYSSPDLGIESDPNHESSAPEQMEKEDIKTISKHQKEIKLKQVLDRTQSKFTATINESKEEIKGTESYLIIGGTVHAIGNLQEFELLKREIKESLVGIKSVLSRTGDGLHHIANYTSPRKNLEYSTLKAIKDTCVNIEICLKEAYRLVNNFWSAPCPSVEEWYSLIQQKQELFDKWTSLEYTMKKRENEFRDATARLQEAKLHKEKMERQITKKLVKTKNVIKKAEKKLIENRCQNLPLVPKYPSEESACQ